MGVTFEVEREGDGLPLAIGNVVKIHYVGTIEGGPKFDSSRDRGKLFEFKLGRGEVIKGLDEGILKLSRGDKAKLIITSDYGYGERGVPGFIPPNATLNFDVEVVEVR